MSTAPRSAVAELVAVMAALRTPGSGCPWDLEQTFKTIAPYTIEEACEVADAIERGDLADLREELGDLLLQVAFHARMAEEAGAFSFEDVAAGIVAKLIRRHPHVFGDAEARSAGAVKGLWESVKAAEKAEKKAARARLGLPPKPAGGLLDDVPLALPALARATKLQERAAKVGFDWPSLSPVLAKMREELAELEALVLPVDPRAVGSVAAARPDAAQRTRIGEELGDLLFVIANVARHLEIDPEAALRGTNAKFQRRFRHIEARLAEDGRTPAQSDLAEMDRLWDEAKRAE
jgi:ATP diphosphatase